MVCSNMFLLLTEHADCVFFILQMQKLMRAAREGTKDGLEKTKAAVKKGRSFIRTKSFISQGMCQLYCVCNSL